MVKQNAIPMDSVKEKLKNLEIYMPEQEETVHIFGKYLADRLNPQLVPAGFGLAAELALHDLQKGVDGYTKQPITNGLQGYPDTVYALLRMIVPDIAKAVCPEDFANGVKEYYEQVRAMMMEKKE